jgi:hypothetical protein
MQNMMTKFNVDLTLENLAGDALTLALAGGDLPDLLNISQSKYTQQLLDGNLVVAMDDYLDQYGTNIKKNTVRNDIIRKFFSNGTGKLYFHTPESGGSNALPVQLWNGYNIRWDLYKEIGAPVLKSDDDYIAALKQMQALNPKTETGDPVYGMGVHNDWGLWAWCIRSLANGGYTSVANYAYMQDPETNDLINNYMDSSSPFWNDMTFFWKLNQAGMLDPDSFTMKLADLIAKGDKGQYLGNYYNGWFAGNYNANLATDPTTIKGGFMPIPFEGSYVAAGGNSLAGWDNQMLMVTSSCKNVERAIMIIDYQDSPEGNRAFWSGEEGVQWSYEGGKAVVKPEAVADRGAANEAWMKTGIGGYGDDWGVVIGYTGDSLSPDGQPYDLFTADRATIVAGLNTLQKDFCAFYKVEIPSDLAANMIKAGTAHDKSKALSNMTACMEPVSDDIKTIDGKVTEIVLKAIPIIVMAENYDAFLAARVQMQADLKAAGADQSWAAWQAVWGPAKEFVTSLLK